MVLPTCSQQGLTHSPMAAHKNFSTSTNPSVSCSPLRVGPTASNTNTSGGARSLRKVSQLPRLRRESEEGEESTGGYVHTAAMYMQHTPSNVKSWSACYVCGRDGGSVCVTQFKRTQDRHPVCGGCHTSHILASIQNYMLTSSLDRNRVWGKTFPSLVQPWPCRAKTLT